MRGEGLFRRYSSKGEKNYRFSQMDAGALHFFWKYLEPHQLSLYGAIAATLLVTACTIAGPYLLMKGIDRYIASRDLTGLTVITLLYIAVNVALWVGTFWQSYLAGAVGEKVVFGIRQDLLAHVESLSLDFFEYRSPGEIMSRLIHDVNTLSDLISTGLVDFVGDVLVIIAIVGMMLLLNTSLALLTFTTIPLIYFFISFWGGKMRKAFQDVRVKIADINSELQENITAIRVVQSMSRKEINIEKFEALNQNNMRANMRAMSIFSLFFPMISFVGSIGTALILWHGGQLVVGKAVSVGLLVAFLQYVERFYRPLREISQSFNLFQSAAASLDRIYEYLKIKAVIAEPAVTSLPSAGFRGEVEFCQVSFAYVKDRPVLQNINMHIESGTTVALVGHTGAGKTTILSLLARLYEVQEGQILIDGVDIRQIAADQLRKVLAVVQQDPFLFSTTVMENIRYGNPSATDEMVIEAAKALGVHDIIEQLPAGYQTDVGRRGERLSGGQVQIIALVRVFLADPLILVLDEATSSLDSRTEANIKQALIRLLEGRTGIIIAHRFVLLELADRIFVLEGGSITASGCHEQVYRQSELYRRLYEGQLLFGDMV
ncbi:ABC transporter related [Desulfofarcimen acetoxidans DSM 771]|uniref:ABC transporter related n=1 Tax=Desulfofarcimen acetoxidans (strain ATCC 49208 / DSM 771 / KCTC 5769 / VKM B-1644 / 5575) TaxID=485916 RepID=C8W610_DESAS|nr:ABC transporter ATP-binding protein [Desulfofarcimen acetoxidans]ACV61465.1 ABC transporter related [Desulfofarcimen acetoxidans DSM 771]